MPDHYPTDDLETFYRRRAHAAEDRAEAAEARVQELEAAIADHQAAILVIGEDPDPLRCDQRLWAVLGEVG
jgi:hypothetical protein